MRLFYTLLLFLFINSLFAQDSTYTVKGYVKDAETLEKLPFANVLVKETTIGVVTNYDGFFTLQVPNNKSKLEITYTGYTSKEVEVSPNMDTLEILMEEGVIFSHHPVIYAPAIESPNYLEQGRITHRLYPRQLNISNQTTILPALNTIPGIFMQSGALNTNRITIRGIGARSLFSTTKMRAYLNDIPLTTGDGETTIEDIDLDILKSVEVFKGPTTSVYGAGLGGTLVLKRKRGRDHQNPKIGSKAIFGSYGLQRYTNHVTLANSDANLSIYHNKTHSDGYRDNNQYDRQSFTVIGDIEVGYKHNLSIIANYIDLKAFIPSSLDSANYADNPEAAAFTWGRAKGNEDYNRAMFGVNLWSQFSEKLKLSNSVFSSFRNNYEVRPFGILDESSLNVGFRSMLALDYRPSYKSRKEFRFGIEGFREAYDWRTYELQDSIQGALQSDNEEIRQYLNLFAEGTIDFSDDWTVTGGINVNQTNYDYTDLYLLDMDDQSGDYTFNWIVSPRVAVKYKAIKDNDWKLDLFANASHGFSPPSLEETLTPDGTINPNIQPEKGWNLELGFEGIYNYHWFLNVSLYSMLINDLLVAQRTDNDAYIGVNAGSTVHNGVETTLRYVKNINNGQIDWKSSYAYHAYRFEDFINDGADYSGNQLTGVPRQTFNSNLNILFSEDFPVRLNINYQFVDAMPMRDDNSVYSEAYQLVNFKLSYEDKFNFKATNDRLKYGFHFGMDNLLNEKYASMILINASSFGGRPPRYFYPGLPRNWYGGVSLSYYF